MPRARAALRRPVPTPNVAGIRLATAFGHRFETTTLTAPGAVVRSGLRATAFERPRAALRAYKPVQVRDVHRVSIIERRSAAQARVTLPERRKERAPLRDDLTPQPAMLDTMAYARWTPRFGRRLLVSAPVPIAIPPDGERFAAPETDGSINPAPDIKLGGATRRTTRGSPAAVTRRSDGT